MLCKQINIWVTLSRLIKKPSIFQNYRWHIHSGSLNLINILQNICLKQLCLTRKACLCCVLLYYRCNSSHRRLHEFWLRPLSSNPRVKSFWTWHLSLYCFEYHTCVLKYTEMYTSESVNEYLWFQKVPHILRRTIWRNDICMLGHCVAER